MPGVDRTSTGSCIQGQLTTLEIVSVRTNEPVILNSERVDIPVRFQFRCRTGDLSGIFNPDISTGPSCEDRNLGSSGLSHDDVSACTKSNDTVGSTYATGVLKKITQHDHISTTTGNGTIVHNPSAPRSLETIGSSIQEIVIGHLKRGKSQHSTHINHPLAGNHNTVRVDHDHSTVRFQGTGDIRDISRNHPVQGHGTHSRLIELGQLPCTDRKVLPINDGEV